MRVGAKQTDVSGNLYRTLQKGNKAWYVITPATNTASFPFVYTTGASWTQKQVTGNGFMSPTTATAVNVRLTILSAGGNGAGVAPNGFYTIPGSATTNPISLSRFIGPSGPVDNSNMDGTIQLESNSIYVYTSHTSDSYVSGIGWVDSVISS